MNRMTQNLPEGTTKYQRTSTNLQDGSKSPRDRLEMWKAPEKEDKKKSEKPVKFKQVVTNKDECEIFEAEEVSDDTLSSDMDTDEEDDDDEVFGDDTDPLAAISKREEA